MTPSKPAKPATPEDLYALPLNEFTAARNKLAKESGDKDVAKLAKPSAAAWALNQAARSNKGDVARFLHAARDVREGGGRSAMADLRAAEADVRHAAQRALGDRAGPQLASINTLLAAAGADESVAEVLRQGTLTGGEEAEATGFVGGAKGGPTRGKPAHTDEVKQARARRAREKALEEARANARQLDEEADRHQREADELEEKAKRARTRADAARAKAHDAAAEVKALEAQGRA